MAELVVRDLTVGIKPMRPKWFPFPSFLEINTTGNHSRISFSVSIVK